MIIKKNNLPENWIIKNDGSDDFTNKVLPYIKKYYVIKYFFDIIGFYIGNNNDFIEYGFTKDYFKNNSTELTVDEFLDLISIKTSENSIQYEVIRNNRFEFKFPEEFNIQSWLLESVTKPKCLFKSNQIVWDNIILTFIDPVGSSSSVKLYSNFINDKNNNFTCYLNSLDPVGITIQRWEILVNNVSSIDFGNCNYGESNITIIEMSLNVSDCKLLF